jgi:hypothetical protein
MGDSVTAPIGEPPARMEKPGAPEASLIPLLTGL